MASINISLRKDAYEFLRSLRGRDRSFSDVVLEFKEKENEKGNVKSILQFAGALRDSDIDWKAKERRMRKFRESFNRRLHGGR